MIFRFVFVGGTTALLYFGLTYVVVEGFSQQATIASSAAYLIAAGYNYLLHYHWTFATNAPHGEVLVKYLLTCAGGVVLNGLVMHFGVLLLPVHYMVVQLLAAGVVICWSLVVSMLWVFARKN